MVLGPRWRSHDRLSNSVEHKRTGPAVSSPTASNYRRSAMTNEQKFEIHYGALLDEAQQITGHAFPRLRELIAERTAVGAARYLLSPVASAGFSWGFELLAAAKLLSHSIEQAALDFAYSGFVFRRAAVQGARSTRHRADALARHNRATTHNLYGRKLNAPMDDETPIEHV